MNSTRPILLALGLALAALALTACGGGEEPAAVTPTDSAAQSERNARSDAAAAVEREAGTVASAVDDMVSDADAMVQNASEAAGDMMDSAEQMASDAADAAEEMVDSAAQMASDAADSAQDMASDAAAAVDQAVNDAAESADEMMQDASAAAGEAMAGGTAAVAAAAHAVTVGDDGVGRITIGSTDQMRFTIESFSVDAGQEVELTLVHEGSLPIQAMGHNLVILPMGSNPATFGGEVMAAGGTVDNDYLPESVRDGLIAYTSLIGGGESDTIQFTAPTEPGEYPFICTFPGHSVLMKGVMVVN